MLEINAANVQTWSEVGSRGAFGKTINDIGAANSNVVVLTADLADATRVREFSRLYPDRFFQVGIAEQNLVGIAAGMALAGKTPVATTFACFAGMRVAEQVRTDVCYPNLNVKLVGADGGFIMGTLGTTHYAFEDIAILRSFPNMVILSPSDGAQIVKATYAAVDYPGPVYIRLTGGKGLPIVYHDDFDFQIGKAITVRPGSDVTLIGTGTAVYFLLRAAEQLAAQGVSARVIDMHTLKPIDGEAVRAAARETRLIVTGEEHNIVGGLGSGIAEVLAEMGGAPPLVRLGLPDRFLHIATYPTMLKLCGLAEENIISVVTSHLVGAAEAV